MSGGKPLTYENYCRYGEWVNTEEIKAMGAANRVEPWSICFTPVIFTGVELFSSLRRASARS